MTRKNNKGLSLVSDSPLCVLDEEYFAWASKGACAKSSKAVADLFFTQGARYEMAAKVICRTQCPVVRECRAFALKYMQEGIWGDTDDHERNKIRKEEHIVGIKLPTMDLSA